MIIIIIRTYALACIMTSSMGRFRAGTKDSVRGKTKVAGEGRGNGRCKFSFRVSSGGGAGTETVNRWGTGMGGRG